MRSFPVPESVRTGGVWPLHRLRGPCRAGRGNESNTSGATWTEVAPMGSSAAERLGRARSASSPGVLDARVPRAPQHAARVPARLEEGSVAAVVQRLVGGPRVELPCGFHRQRGHPTLGRSC